MKYHNTPDGPKVCRASKRACKYGEVSSHFEDLASAQKAYETMMENDGGMGFTPMPLSQATQLVIDRLSAAGIKPLLVGGCVRDHLLGKESKDVDLELYGAKPDGTSLEFADVQKAFQGVPGITMDEAGADFSVLKMRARGEDFDLALPRTEQSTGDHHRDYEVVHDTTMSFDEAASRRDFTINSMGYDPATKELLDPYGGAKDLKAGILRHVGPAFSDDPLRCLRAVNFASRFNLQVAPETLSLCRELAPAYKTLARERVEEEFTKALTKGKHLQRGFETFHDIGWSEEMKAFKGADRRELASLGKRLDKTPVPLRRAVLARAMKQNGRPDPTEELTGVVKEQRLVQQANAFFDAAQKSSWGDVVATHRKLKTSFPTVSNKQLSEAMRATGEDTSMLKNLPETPVPTVVTGRELIARGFKPGPEMGKLIAKAQAIQDNESLYDFDKLLARAVG